MLVQSINEYGLTNNAVFSDGREYRYILGRDCIEKGRVAIWIMLNPSIGDESILETTTLGCMKRSQNWGYSGMLVLNLFALVATNPQKLRIATDPVGKFNDLFIKHVLKAAKEQAPYDVIAAGGRDGKYLNRDREVLTLLENEDLFCLGVNKDGTPRHPLHMSHSIRPELWREAKK